MIWQGAKKQVGTENVTPVVRVSIFDPSGTYVANSRPQGGSVSANYANLDIRKPARRHLYRGDLHPGQRRGVHRFGQPADHLPAGGPDRSGQPAGVHARAGPDQERQGHPSRCRPRGGDTTYAVTFASSDGHQTAVRRSSPARGADPGGQGSFSGTITGGNARAGSAAQTFTYAFDVPNGQA